MSTVLAWLVYVHYLRLIYFVQSHRSDSSQLKPLRIITDWNRTAVCPVLCQFLCNELNYVLTCLQRIKSELHISQRKIKTICEDRLKVREKAICHRMVLIILATTSFIDTVIPLGQCTESVFNLLYQVYHTVNIVTKHFLARSSCREPVYKQALLSISFMSSMCFGYYTIVLIVLRMILGWSNYPK